MGNAFADKVIDTANAQVDKTSPASSAGMINLTNARQAIHAAGGPRLPTLKPLEIAEQVVGSKHMFSTEPPFAVGPAHIGVSLAGSDAFIKQPVMYELGIAETARMIDVIYTPTSAGTHRAHLEFTAAWDDGHVESATTEVTASARMLQDPPSATKDVALTTSTPQAALPSTQPDAVLTASVEHAFSKVRSAIEQLHRERAIGVGDVELEALAYVRPPPAPPSVWWDLAALAVTLGTAGLGSAIGMGIEAALDGEVAKAISKGIGKLADKALGAGADAAKKELASLASVHERQPTEAGAPSTDHTIAFFSQQQSALNTAGRASSNVATDVLTGIAIEHQTDVASVIKGALTLERNIDQTNNRAKSEQARHSAAQWIAYRGRVALGTVPGIHNGDPRTTYMAGARQDPGVAYGMPAGILDVHVDPIPSHSGRNAYRVVGAEIRGVAQSVADRLLTMDLRATRIPFRIVIAANRGVITRDEVGRVRYVGTVDELIDDRDAKLIEGPGGLGLLDPMPAEEHSIAGAERIVNMVMVGTLAQHGVKAIKTDDRGRETE